MSEKIVVGRGTPEVQAALDGLLEGEDSFAAEATREKIEALREHHVLRYRRMLGSRSPHVNVEECERLLGLWLGMAGKGFSELDEDQKLEVLDAIAAGVL